MHALLIGAHPDDVDASMGGTAALLAQRGDTVQILSVTDGARGHFDLEYRDHPERLAARRYAEATEAAHAIGATYECLGIRDGDVYVDQHLTEALIRAVRLAGPEQLGPDLVVTNRPNDYHRDHRYTAQAVLDASYMLTVPHLCPDAPSLRRMPVILYWHDRFREGGEFRADAIVDVGPAAALKGKMVRAHESQFLEWIPYNAGVHSDWGSLPDDRDGALDRVEQLWADHDRQVADRYRSVLREAVLMAEAFQVSEYGAQPTPAELAELLPRPYIVEREGTRP